MSSQNEISMHLCLPEPKLGFHPDREADSDIHPLRGLIEFGPYSAGWVPDPIRVATVAPYGDRDRLYSFMKRLHTSCKPNERKDYLPTWPGFHRVFGLHLRAADRHCHIALDAELESDFAKSLTPHEVLATRLVRAIQDLQENPNDFDVIVIYIPQRWSRGYTGSQSNDDFDLHDHLKASDRGYSIAYSTGARG